MTNQQAELISEVDMPWKKTGRLITLILVPSAYVILEDLRALAARLRGHPALPWRSRTRAV